MLLGVHAFGYLLKPVKEPDIKRQSQGGKGIYGKGK